MQEDEHRRNYSNFIDEHCLIQVHGIAYRK